MKNGLQLWRNTTKSEFDSNDFKAYFFPKIIPEQNYKN